EIVAVQRRVDTAKPQRDVDSSAALIDVQVPGRFSLQALVRYARRLAHIPETHISGNVFREGDVLRLLLRSRDGARRDVICDRSGTDLRALLRDAAIDVLTQVDPYVAAISLMGSAQDAAGLDRALRVIEHIIAHRPRSEHPWAHIAWGHVLIRRGRQA